MTSRGLRRARLVFVFVPLLVLTFLLGAFALFLLRTGSQIRRYESLAQARKEPLTLEGVARAYASIPEDENAAVPLLNLWRSEDPEFWAAFEAGERQLPRNRAEQPIPFPDGVGASKARSAQAQADDLGPLADHVAARREHREAVRQALGRVGFRFPIRITDGVAALLPHLGRLKREAQEFEAEGWVATERGDTTAALRAMQDSARIGTLLRDDPFLVGQLVRIACNSICVRQAERLLSGQALTEPQLRELETVLTGLSAEDGFHRAMVGERAMGLSVFHNPSAIFEADPSGEGNEAVNPVGLSVIMSMHRISGLKQADRRLYLETIQHLITNAPINSPARLVVIEDTMGNTMERVRRFPPSILSGILLPAMSRAAQKFVQLEAQCRSALTAVAVERYRLSHDGNLPETLMDLFPARLPEMPEDPFDGAPLRYNRLESGYVVYSIGPDRIDHGGREKPKKGGTSQFDVTFTVRR